MAAQPARPGRVGGRAERLPAALPRLRPPAGRAPGRGGRVRGPRRAGAAPGAQGGRPAVPARGPRAGPVQPGAGRPGARAAAATGIVVSSTTLARATTRLEPLEAP